MKREKMKTQRLVGKAKANGRFYKVKVKVADLKEKFTLRRMKEKDFKELITTYANGQAAADKYFADQREAFEYLKQKRVVKPIVEKVAAVEQQKLGFWASIIRFIKKLLGIV